MPPPLAPFRIGSKQVFLPNFRLTLLRTPNLPPTHAAFITPLSFNKLDIRDYLFHAYGITCFRIRSYVHQHRVRQGKPRAVAPKRGQWFRPRATKRITVEMDKPFVWPDEPEDFTPWSKKTNDAAQEAQKQAQESHTAKAQMQPAEDRDTVAEQARRLLEGKEKWRPQWQVDSDTNWQMRPGQPRL
ncbi:MAG: hypothetical protein M1820_003326 [Bogoriella megaspora]|nr:MAG: hypothetical protein M1820_003326 [Bogoriella megaspora]